MLISTGDERSLRRPATVEDQVAEFTRVYEARAYLIYNVALRTTCEPASALAVAETAFLGLARESADETALLPAAVAAALTDAKRKPKPGGVAETEMSRLRAAAALAPTERVALALAVLAQADSEQLGALLLVDPDQAAELLERAGASFAAQAGVSHDDVYEVYGAWAWADPPVELWERVYPAFRRALERPAAVAADQPTRVLPAAGARPRGPRRLRRRMAAVATTVLAGLIAAGVLAYTQGNKSPSTPQSAAADAPYDSSAAPPPSEPAPLPPASNTGTPVDPVAAVQAKKHKPLTPKELDQLRLQELAVLRNYQKRETDKRLSKAQRDYAAGKVGALRDLARERAAVQRHERELAKRERRLAKAQQKAAAQKQKPAADNSTTSRPQQQQSSQPPPLNSSSGSSNDSGSSQDQSSGPPTQQQAQQECLQDADTGQFICPPG